MAGHMLTASQGRGEGLGSTCIWGLRASSLSLHPYETGWQVATSCGPTHPVVLIRCHGRELGLREDEGLEVLLSVALAVFAWVHKDHVEAGLVAVHGTENDLWGMREGLCRGGGQRQALSEAEALLPGQRGCPGPAASLSWAGGVGSVSRPLGFERPCCFTCSHTHVPAARFAFRALPYPTTSPPAGLYRLSPGLPQLPPGWSPCCHWPHCPFSTQHPQ